MIELKVIKNTGRVESFSPSKLFEALRNTLIASGTEAPSGDEVQKIYDLATSSLPKEGKIHVSDIHDAVERSLMTKWFEAGRVYISRREEKRREKGRPIPPAVRKAFDSAKEYFPDPIQQFQFYNKYSRFNHELGRRETWPETVERVVDYLKHLNATCVGAQMLEDREFEIIREKILKLEVMPSMRLVAMAGEAAKRNNIAIYNCSFMGIDHPYTFVEALIISMSGCGVGFSVEKQFVERLPVIGSEWLETEEGLWDDTKLRAEEELAALTPLYFSRRESDPNQETITYVVPDTSEGWAEAMWAGLCHWFNGCDTIKFDYSQLRPAGAILKTKGGTSSGPDPLRRMLEFMRSKLLSKRGQRLSSLDVHDIMCIIGDCVVQGGVRRSAMISIHDWDDQEMRAAKSGSWWEPEEKGGSPWRSNANNSTAWPNRKLSDREITDFVLEMDASGSGENGIFSRSNAWRLMPSRRFEALSDEQKAKIGTNPCGEIRLLSNEFCNLSIAVARPGMTKQQLKDSVEIATIIGTLQSTATHFPGLRNCWADNCKRERLLGVDITGQADVDYLDAEFMRELRDAAVATNKIYADILAIPQSASVTCVKPSGNSSVFLGCAPGINRRWSDFQIRRTRLSANSVMAKVLLASGMNLSPENGQTPQNVTTYVASWPARTPQKGAPTTRERCAIDQCEVWKKNKLNWTEHNPSVTITYHKDELIDLIHWIKDNQSIIEGMAFLPASDSVYQQMPNEEISESEYHELVGRFPDIDFAMLYAYEEHDTTTSAQELACVGGACALDF